MSELEKALDLLSEAHEPEPCWFDHHGHCQEHHGGFSEDGCLKLRIGEFLKQHGRLPS